MLQPAPLRGARVKGSVRANLLTGLRLNHLTGALETSYHSPTVIETMPSREGSFYTVEYFV